MQAAVARDAGHYFVASKLALLGAEQAVDAVQRAWLDTASAPQPAV